MLMLLLEEEEKEITTLRKMGFRLLRFLQGDKKIHMYFSLLVVSIEPLTVNEHLCSSLPHLKVEGYMLAHFMAVGRVALVLGRVRRHFFCLVQCSPAISA